MVCKKCGTEIGNSRVCMNCGAAVTQEERKCAKCGALLGEARFCGNCGTDSLASTAGVGNGGVSADTLASKVHNTIEEMTGGNTSSVKLKLSDLWSDVFAKHSKKETDTLLLSGTYVADEREEDLVDNWTRPWLYSRVFAALLVAFAFLYGCLWLFGNTKAVPGIMFIGSTAVPFSLLVLFWETNIPRNISLLELVKMFFVGGCASLLVTLTLFFFAGSLGNSTGVLGAVVVGVIEEIAKLVIVAFFIRSANTKYILNGILIGAAIGAGFSAFESAGYAFTAYVDNGLLAFLQSGGDYNQFVTTGSSQMMEVILLRGFLAAGGHVVWAAMSGAAIMFAKGDGELKFGVFNSPKFLRLFLVPVVLHALWDMPFTSVPYVVGITAVAWIFILPIIKSGMAEITRRGDAARKARLEREAAEAAAAAVAAETSDSVSDNDYINVSEETPV